MSVVKILVLWNTSPLRDCHGSEGVGSCIHLFKKPCPESSYCLFFFVSWFFFNLCGSLYIFSTQQHFHPPMTVKTIKYFSCRCPLIPGANPPVSSPTFQWLEAWRLTAITTTAKVLPGTDASQRDCLDRFTYSLLSVPSRDMTLIHWAGFHPRSPPWARQSGAAKSFITAHRWCANSSK